MRREQVEIPRAIVEEMAELIGTVGLDESEPTLQRLVCDSGASLEQVVQCIREVMKWPKPLRADLIADSVGLTRDQVIRVACAALSTWHDVEESELINAARLSDEARLLPDRPRTHGDRVLSGEPGTLPAADALLKTAAEALDEADRAVRAAWDDPDAGALFAWRLDDPREVPVALVIMQRVRTRLLKARPRLGKGRPVRAALGWAGDAAWFAAWAWEANGRAAKIRKDKKRSSGGPTAEREQFDGFARCWLTLLGVEHVDAALRDRPQLPRAVVRWLAKRATPEEFRAIFSGGTS